MWGRGFPPRGRFQKAKCSARFRVRSVTQILSAPGDTRFSKGVMPARLPASVNVAMRGTGAMTATGMLIVAGTPHETDVSTHQEAEGRFSACQVPQGQGR